MQTRTYSDLIALIEAFAGCQFAPIELPRIKAFVNERAQQAYDATSYWPRWLVVGEERSVTSSVIPFEEEGKNTVGDFLRIFVTDPMGINSSQEYDYSVTADGAFIVSANLDPTTAFVTYKILFDTTYGDGNQGETTTIPAEWFQYIAHGVSSDFLRGEGQHEKALIEDQKADEKLADELIKPQITRTAQLVGNKVSTNLNMQVRAGYVYSGYSI